MGEYIGTAPSVNLTKPAYRQGEAIRGTVTYTATRLRNGVYLGWHTTVTVYDEQGNFLDDDATNHPTWSEYDYIAHTTELLNLGVMGTANKRISVVVTAGG